MAFGRKEHVDEGKGARRNGRPLPDEGNTVEGAPMRRHQGQALHLTFIFFNFPATVTQSIVSNVRPDPYA